MYNQDIQFVIISSDITRKEIMHKQFKDLELDSAFNIHYEDGITINNSPYDLKLIYPFDLERPLEEPEVLCCFFSHIKAMKWFIHNSNHPYLLLLEDDVAIQKINFKENLLELIPKFQNKKFDYISLGYLINNISDNLLNHPLIYKDNNLYWNLYKKYLHTTWGTQAQLFPRETVKSYLSIYDKSSTKDIKKSIYSYLDKNEFYYINPPRLQIDCLNGLLKHQCIVFPPMVIELNNINSLISKEQSYKRWEEGQIRGIYNLNNYYSYEDNKSSHKFFKKIKNEINANILEMFCRFVGYSCVEFRKNMIEKLTNL